MATLNSKNNMAETKPRSMLKKKIRKYLFITLMFFVLVVAGYVYWSFFFTFSDGYRAGMLQKFSRKGNIFKTYEGEMILSSVQSNQNVTLASEKFLFSVSDKEIALQLDTLQGRNVIVHYTQKVNTLPWRGETTFIVSSVKLSN